MGVFGVDGCRGGWVVAAESDVVVVPTFADVLELAGDHGIVGVDMPIGLPESGPRACDVEARRLLGPRRSSVFPAPPRRALGWTTWADASGLSVQAFNLLPKIAEVDALMTPALQDRVVEVHPEASFAEMTGAPMAWPKRTAAGRAERFVAVTKSLGVDALPRLRGAAADDVLDAYAVRWSALRLARGDGRRLGDGAVDSCGLRMEIVV